MTHPYTHDMAEIRVLKLSGYRQLPLEYMPEKAQYCLQHHLFSWTHENVIKVTQVRSMESKSPCCREEAGRASSPLSHLCHTSPALGSLSGWH